MSLSFRLIVFKHERLIKIKIVKWGIAVQNNNSAWKFEIIVLANSLMALVVYIGTRYRRLGCKSPLTRLWMLSPEVISYYKCYPKKFLEDRDKKGYDLDLYMRIITTYFVTDSMKT